MKKFKGGAIHVLEDTNLVIQDNILFKNNVAGQYGGGIFIRDKSILTLNNSIQFRDNFAFYGN